MNILHICLAASYTEGMNYQDNLLPAQNRYDGHEVLIVSDCHKYENGRLIKTSSEMKILEDGSKLIRIEYDRIINDFVSCKIRKVTQLYNILTEFKPDIVLFHGMAGWELLTVAKYKKKNPKIRLYIDSHEDFNNSARNIFSRIIQYKLFNRMIVNKILPYVDKVFYVSFESLTFLEKLYKIPKSKTEFFPLGGIIIDPLTRQTRRKIIRQELGFSEDDIVFMHSGKMTKEKRTKELLTAFKKVKNDKLKLILVGSFPDDLVDEFYSLIETDYRIKFLGWKSGKDIISYLCACDMYVQPGSQSATMQNAICCGCPVMLYPYASHKAYLKNNGYYVKSIDCMVDIFKSIIKEPEKLKIMSEASYKIAYEMLDYKKLAERLYL